MNGTWISLEIGGKSADVYQPGGIARPRFGILYLHGASLETLADRPVASQLFDELRLACVCPHGGYSWWSDRMSAGFDPQISAERYLLQSVVPFFRERWGIVPPAIGLLGFSMGGQGALRLGFKHPEKFPAVAAVASAIEYYELYGRGMSVDEMYDSKEQCRQDSAPMHIHPSRFPPYIFFCIDPADRDWFRGNDRLHEKLNALGVTHEIDFETQAGGHSWHYFDNMADRTIRFLAAALEQQSRRLL
jgi:S-formylglutathione hydrolase